MVKWPDVWRNSMPAAIRRASAARTSSLLMANAGDTQNVTIEKNRLRSHGLSQSFFRNNRRTARFPRDRRH
jgi:hypothetical protein